MDIEVEVVSSTYSVSLNAPEPLEVITNVAIPNFGDLADFNDSNKNNNYLIAYNASTQQYELVNPDTVLSAAVSDPAQPGLPSDFVDELDVDLDDRINLDAGTF